LPQGWTIAPISDLFIINPRNSVDDKLDVSFVPMTLIDDGFSNRFSYQERKWGEVKSGFTHFADGDVGIAKITPCLENRKSAVFSNLKNGIGAGTTELHIFRAINKATILPEYLLWFFKAESFISSCIGAFSGAVGQQRVSKDHIANTILPLPSFAEQCRIVMAIESAFTIISEIEQNKGDLLSTVTAAKSKILSFAISGKLVAQDENDEPASALLERIQTERNALARKGKIKKDTSVPVVNTTDSSHYGDLPESWAISRLGEICNVANGFAFNSGDYKSNGVPLIRISNIKSGFIDLSDCVFIDENDIPEKDYYVQKGDLLIAMSGATTGKMGIYNLDNPTLLNQRVGNIKTLYPNVLLDEYKNYAMSSFAEIILASAYGGAQPNINSNGIENLLFALPPLAEQRRIVAAIEAAFGQLDEILRVLN